jgi:hypothetical protein
MGRSPAVEPVSGLSIDKYQEGKGTKVKDPNKAGYDWNKTVFLRFDSKSKCAASYDIFSL